MQRAASVARQALDAGIKAKVDHSFFIPAASARTCLQSKADGVPVKERKVSAKEE
jgi:hypothetical protein